MPDVLPSIERRLDLLQGGFDRARRYQTGMVAFVICQVEDVRAAFEEALVGRLQTVGLHVRRLRFQPNAPPELRTVWRSLLLEPPTDDEVIFVYELRHAFPELLNSLNYRREFVPDYRWRLLFWAVDEEVTHVIRRAPDFWAFVNQIIELP